MDLLLRIHVCRAFTTHVFKSGLIKWNDSIFMFGLSTLLFDVFVDGFAQIVNGLFVAFVGGVDDSVLQMVLRDDLSGVVDG